MPSRSRRVHHCDRCELFEPLCICGAIAEVRAELQGELTTQVVVLMHVREETLPTNTARLAQAAIPGSQLRLRGARERPMDSTGLESADYQSLLLYPSEQAIELNAESLSLWRKPVRLIVPDGSWRQARKVAAREPALSRMPQVKLPTGAPSRYRLRKEPNAQSVSTFEAIARALGVLEGPTVGPGVRVLLEQLFELRIERTLWARGVLNASQCRFPVPPAAYETFYRDGCRGGEKAKALLLARRAREAAALEAHATENGEPAAASEAADPASPFACPAGRAFQLSEVSTS